MGDTVVIHRWDVKVVDQYGVTQYSKSYDKFDDAFVLYSEMRPVLYEKERVLIMPMREKDYEC